MRKVLALAVLMLLPLAAAHVEQNDSQHNAPEHPRVDAQLGPGASGPNDFSRVNPFVLAADGKYGSAALFAAVWLGLLAGVWQLIKLVIARVIAAE